LISCFRVFVAIALTRLDPDKGAHREQDLQRKRVFHIHARAVGPAAARGDVRAMAAVLAFNAEWP
jgi:hypothetical protein